MKCTFLKYGSFHVELSYCLSCYCFVFPRMNYWSGTSGTEIKQNDLILNLTPENRL